VVLLVLCLLLGSASAAAANDNKVTAAQKKEAKQYFIEGSRAFANKDYSAAVESFRRSYDIVRSPEIVYNIGRCYEALGQIDDALYHYEMFLRFYPTAADAEDARLRIAMLEELKRKSAQASGTDASSPSDSALAPEMEALISKNEERSAKLDRESALASYLSSRLRLSMGLGGAMGFGTGGYYEANRFAFLPFDIGLTLRMGAMLGVFIAFDYARYAEKKGTGTANHTPERRVGAVLGLRWLIPVGKLALDLSAGGLVDYVQFNHPEHPGFYGGRLTFGVSVPVSLRWSFFASALFDLGVLHATAATGETELQGEAGARLGFECAF
jgi:tetratricopeptide (TPR) repeat protein